jgi:hypothetical protein
LTRVNLEKKEQTFFMRAHAQNSKRELSLAVGLFREHAWHGGEPQVGKKRGVKRVDIAMISFFHNRTSLFYLEGWDIHTLGTRKTILAQRARSISCTDYMVSNKASRVISSCTLPPMLLL